MRTVEQQRDDLTQDLASLDFQWNAAVRVAELIMSLNERIAALEATQHKESPDV